MLGVPLEGPPEVPPARGHNFRKYFRVGKFFPTQNIDFFLSSRRRNFFFDWIFGRIFICVNQICAVVDFGAKCVPSIIYLYPA